MMICTFLSFLLLMTGLCAPHCAYALPLRSKIAHGKAVQEAMCGDWPAAQQKMVDVLGQQNSAYGCADLLFDTGVAAYRNKEFEAALSYFGDVDKCADATQAAKLQAWFNAGNAALMLKRYQDAIDWYDKVLAVQPRDERALHNREYARKMLEQEKDQPPEDQENKDQEKDQQDQQSSDDKNEQQSESDQNDQQQDKSDQQKNKNNKGGQNKQQNQRNSQDQQQDSDDQNEQDNQPSEQQNKKDQRKTGKDRKPSDQAQESDADDRQQEPPDNQNNQNKQNKQQPKSSDAQRKEEQKAADQSQKRNAGQPDQSGQQKSNGADESKKADAQNAPSAKQGDAQAGSPANQAQEGQAPQPGQEKDWMVALLEQQEERDKQAQRKQMKIIAARGAPKGHGQHNW